jgi:hypothetical protein
MLMVTPCTDWYLIFTGIAKGNVALSTAILPFKFNNTNRSTSYLSSYFWRYDWGYRT